jgi:hypothetical protein
LSTDGRKIPFLPKATIFKLMKTIGKTISVAIYVEYEYNNSTEKFVIEIYPNGLITVTSELNKAVSTEEMNAILKTALNPIFKEVENKLEQSGYKLSQFNSLADENIDIHQLTYLSQIKINKQVELNKIKGCVTSIFNIESMQPNNIQLRFKRVSNFNKVTSQEAFIIEKSEQGLRGEQIIHALLENYKDDITRKEAEDLLRKMANEYEVERTAHKSGTKIKNNPGFKTSIITDTKTSIATIQVDNINDINYLKTIPLYLDTMMRLTQNKKTTTYPDSKINKICNLETKEEVIKLDDIVSIGEMSNSNKEELSSSDDEYPSETEEEKEEEKEELKPIMVGEKQINAMDLFFDEDDQYEEYNDDENNDNNNLKGGNEDTTSISDNEIIANESENEEENEVRNIDGLKLN